MYVIVKKALVGLGILGVVVLGAGIASQNINTSKPEDFVVRLVMNGATFCSGTVVNNTTVVTAAHCVLINTPFGPMLYGGDIEIRTADNVTLRVNARVTAAQPQLDEAVLTGNFSDFKKAQMITNIKKIDALRSDKTDLMSCGFPLGGDLHCSKMIFKNRDNFSWAVYGLLLPGMSGGPLLYKGNIIIGVNNAVRDDQSIVTPIYNIDHQFTR